MDLGKKESTLIFALPNQNLGIGLGYGVTVALQILILSV